MIWPFTTYKVFFTVVVKNGNRASSFYTTTRDLFFAIIVKIIFPGKWPRLHYGGASNRQKWGCAGDPGGCTRAKIPKKGCDFTKFRANLHEIHFTPRREVVYRGKKKAEKTRAAAYSGTEFWQQNLRPARAGAKCKHSCNAWPFWLDFGRKIISVQYFWEIFAFLQVLGQKRAETRGFWQK